MRAEQAWAAGLFDGEGTAGPRTVVNRGKEYYYPYLKVSMCNEQAVRRFRAAVGVGRVTGPHGPYDRGTKPQWYWQCSTKDGRVVWALLAPFLCDEKLVQVRRAYAESGHELEEVMPGELPEHPEG